MRQSPRLLPPDERDPREGRSAEVIDLATRSVLPQVTQRQPRSEAATLLGGIAVVALLGAVTLWSMNGARQARQAVPAVPAPVRADVPPAVPPQAITELKPRPAAPLLQPGVAGQPAGQVAPAPAANPANAPAVVFDVPDEGVSPGQACVLYAVDQPSRVLGGGFIASTQAAA